MGKKRTETIVKKPDGSIAGRIIKGVEGLNKIVHVKAYNMDTAKAYIRSHGYTITESETRGKKSYGNRTYVFYLGKKKKR